MTYIFNDALVVPVRVGVFQQTLEGVSVLFVANKALFVLVTSDRHQTYNELPDSGTALRKLNAFLHGYILSNRDERVQVVDNMAKRGGLHHRGEGVKQRRFVGFEVVKIKAKRFESNHVEDCFPDFALNYKIVSSVAQKRGRGVTYCQHYRVRCDAGSVHRSVVQPFAEQQGRRL